jgi:hypothetical protein
MARRIKDVIYLYSVLYILKKTSRELA